MPKILPKETKISALERWSRGDDPYQIAKEIGVTVPTLKNWRNEALNENHVKEYLKPVKTAGSTHFEGVGAFEGVVAKLQKNPGVESDLFETGKIDIAAVLLLFNMPVLSLTELDEYNRRKVQFKNTKELQEIVEKYNTFQLNGSLNDFNSKIYQVRKMLLPLR